MRTLHSHHRIAMSTPPTIEIIPPHPPFPTQETRKKPRLVLFISLFLLSLAASLTYIWLRTPLYQSTASLLTVAPEEEGQTETTVQAAGLPGIVLTEQPKGKGGAQHVALQRQILLGMPVFTETLRRLYETGNAQNLPRLSGAELHKLLSVNLVPDTNLVELKAEGPQPELLAPLVNTWVDAYQALREQTVQAAAQDSHTALEEEFRQLGERINAKRAALERFRADHDILLKSDTDNTPMVRLRGVNEAINKAIDEQAKSKAKLDAIHAALARGEPLLPPEESASLANLEKRAQELRELQKELKRRYTPAYLALQPQFKQVPEQLAQVQTAIREKVETGSRALLSQAEQAHASARQTVLELQQKADSLKHESAEFSNRFAEQETMRADLERLEGMHRELQAKLAKIETKPKDTYPPLQVVERAYPPTQAAWPDYWRDSGIALGASLGFALVFIGIYDFLTRIEEKPAAAPTAMPSFQFYSVQGNLPTQAITEEIPALLPKQTDIPLALESPQARELGSYEIQILFDAANAQTRLWMGLLLSGVSLEEIIQGLVKLPDLSAGELHIDGLSARVLPLSASLQTDFKQTTFVEETDSEEIEARIRCAAFDAGLPSADTLTATTLRHTYIAYLVRQGIRLSELERIVGRIPGKALAQYGRYSPPGPGLSADKINWVHPALLA